jgi:hypothetical protein
MRLLKQISIIVALGCISQSCIKKVDVETRNVAPILVVEGAVTTDTVPYTVKLTYSGPLGSSENIPDQYLEKNATVTISDDLGNNTTLVYRDQGVYETTDPAYIGKAGRTYQVTVLLKNGKKYVSIPEKIKAPVPVTQVSTQFVYKFNFDFPTYLNIYADAKDPGQEENYYRWTFINWVLRQTKGVSCGFGCIMYEYCYQKYVDKEVRLLSDAAINGNDIKNQLVGRCYIYSYGNPLIDIAQQSLSREAYQFWRAYQDQQSRTGSILDPLPASIKGNVRNAADSTDYALGYFSAYSIAHKKAILLPMSITPYLLEISARQFIPDQSVACFSYFPNTLAYTYTPGMLYKLPPGWENAEQVKVSW